MAEIAANNNDFVSIKLYPFFPSKGLNLYISFNVINFSNIIIQKRINKKKAINISKAI